MSETISQGFFMHLNTAEDIARIGAAVITRDEILAVAGFVGVMPYPVAAQLLKAASAGGAEVTIVHNDPPEQIVALTWGKFDIDGLWPLIAQGIATSSVQALADALDLGVEIVTGIDIPDETEKPQ